MIKNFIKKLKSLKPLNRRILVASSLFFSFSLLFPAGSFSASAHIEASAEYFSEISQNHTRDGLYSYLLVEARTNSDSLLPSTYGEYIYWNNVFNATKDVFFGVVNGNKENECYFSDFVNQEPLTFVYANVFSNKANGEYWKHEYYDFDLMFSGSHSANNYYSFCYLTQSQANSILNKEDPTKEEYQNLIGTPVSITMNGIEYQWAIANIILETTNAVEVCNSLFGNFVLGHTKYPENFIKQNCYVFNKYIYQNYYKLNYLKSAYSPASNVFLFGSSNYDGEANIESQNIIDMIFGEGISSTLIMAVLLSFSFLLFLLSFCLLFMYEIFNKKKEVVLLLIIIFSPFIIFKGLYTLFNNVLLFSYQALLFYLVLLIVLILFYLFWALWFNNGVRQKNG
ncbi:MAG: hypothetical protein WC366_03690 [Bacilli bacterium]|jgi:hypothetical protein